MGWCAENLSTSDIDSLHRHERREVDEPGPGLGRKQLSRVVPVHADRQGSMRRCGTATILPVAPGC